MKTILLIIALQIICSTASPGQYKVLLTENKEMKATDIEVNNNSVVLTTGNDKQTLKKSDILCVITDSGKSYTFRQKNGKKFKVLKKDIRNNFQGEDIARLFAYKYYKSDVDIGRIYNSFSDIGLSEDEFESAFTKQEKKFKTRTIVSASILSVVLLITSGVLITTIAEASSIQ